jgi:hypothetical protein
MGVITAFEPELGAVLTYLPSSPSALGVLESPKR